LKLAVVSVVVACRKEALRDHVCVRVQENHADETDRVGAQKTLMWFSSGKKVATKASSVRDE
jgi:hypothetical protein